jgi:hypothetical protein
MKGGKVEGIGGSGIVLSNPRLPLIGEKYNNIKNNILECSKLFFNESVNDFDYNSYKNELDSYKSLKEKQSKLSSLDDYIVMYTKSGQISNVEVLLGKDSYDNETWWNYSSNPDSSKKLKQIFGNSIKNIKPIYQIVFPLGKSISLDDIQIFIIKYIHIFECIQVFNQSDLIFDDLKLDNIVKINDTYKLIDCSSIFSFEEIITDGEIRYTILKNISYYIYSVLIHILLLYFLDKKKNKNKYINEQKYNKFIKEKLNEYKTNNYKTNVFTYLKNIFGKESIITFSFLKFSIQNIKLIESEVSISIENILKTLLFDYKENIRIIIIQYYYKYLYSSLKNKNTWKSKNSKNHNENYDETIIHILYFLQKRINIYFLGMVIFDYLYQKQSIKDNSSIFLFELACLCCLQFYYDETSLTFYINDITIEELLEKYKSFINIL